MKALRERFVDNAREILRYWSLKLDALGTAFVAWFIASPESAIAAWAMLPEDLKNTLPPQIVGYFGIGLFAASLISRFIKQPGLKRHEG
jgi:Ca2+/Na+ antiporter